MTTYLTGKEKTAYEHTDILCSKYEKRIKRLYNDLKTLDTDINLYDLERLYYLEQLRKEIEHYLENVNIDI